MKIQKILRKGRKKLESSIEESEVIEEEEDRFPPVQNGTQMFREKPKFRKVDAMTRKELLKSSVFNKVLNDSSLPFQ